MNNEWDNIIKEKLGAFEEAPPAYMWDKIASGIPAATTKVAFYKTLTFKITSIAASIILLLGFAWLMSDNNSAKNKNSIAPLVNTNPQQNKHSDQAIDNNTKQINSSKSDKNIIASNNNSQTKTITNDFSDKSNSPVNTKAKSNNASLINSSKTQINNEPIENLAQNTTASSDNNEIIASKVNVTPKHDANMQSPKVVAEASSAEIAVTTTNISTPNTNATNSTSGDNSQQTLQANTSVAIANAETNTSVNIEASAETQSAENSTVVISENNENQNEAELSQVSTSNDTTEENHIADYQQEMPKSDFHPKTRTFNRIGFGVHYGIESIQIDDKNLLTNNIDLSFNFQNLSFIMQSGIGMQYSQDVRGYNLEYMRNDYLATEMRFDSAVFVMDSTGNVSLVPVNPYYTDVYDSIHHTHNASYNEKYYSLRIPVMIGYQKDFKRMGLFAKGGIFYSRVIYRQKTAIYEPDESSRMIKIDYTGSERVSNQIQYVFSAGFAYRFSRNLQFSGELMTKYYQNSLYDNPDYANLNPWSLEGRIGLVYFL
jgi:hypothetical protein